VETSTFDDRTAIGESGVGVTDQARAVCPGSDEALSGGVDIDAQTNPEERIVNFSAAHGREALREAKQRGRAAQHHYKNGDGNPVYFEFVGVMQLLRLDPACDADEVWYEFTKRVRPMERRASILPPERRLSAIRNDE